MIKYGSYPFLQKLELRRLLKYAGGSGLGFICERRENKSEKKQKSKGNVSDKKIWIRAIFKFFVK